MSRIALVVMCGIVLALGAAGCGGDKRIPVSDDRITGPESPGEPLWVSSPSRAFPDLSGKVIFGVAVGEAKRLPGIYLRRRTAIDRARNELAGQLRVFIASVFKDYTEAAFTPSMDEAESRTLTSNVQKSVVDETLLGAETKEVWKDPNTADYYALVSLSMDSVTAQLRQKILEVEKTRLRKDADTAHAELDEIIEKHRASIK